MKLLSDQNLSFRLCKELADLHPGSMQTGLLGLRDADDHAVWDVAREGGFILVTQDADFAEMAALFGPPPKAVWLGCENRPTSYIDARIRHHAAALSAFAADDRLSCPEIG